MKTKKIWYGMVQKKLNISSLVKPKKDRMAWDNGTKRSKHKLLSGAKTKIWQIESKIGKQLLIWNQKNRDGWDTY